MSGMSTERDSVLNTYWISASICHRSMAHGFQLNKNSVKLAGVIWCTEISILHSNHRFLFSQEFVVITKPFLLYNINFLKQGLKFFDIARKSKQKFL